MFQAVNYKVDESKSSVVEATFYMAFHTLLKSSKEYYGALREARVISDNITDMINADIKQRGGNTSVHVFPYRFVTNPLPSFIVILSIKENNSSSFIKEVTCYKVLTVG